jgi:hypothetical protein
MADVLLIHSANATGEQRDGNLIVHLAATDGNTYELLMTRRGAYQCLSSLLFSAYELPDKGEEFDLMPIMVPGTVDLAIGSGVSAILELSLGGLPVGLKLSDTGLAALHAKLARHLESLSKKH